MTSPRNCVRVGLHEIQLAQWSVGGVGNLWLATLAICLCQRVLLGGRRTDCGDGGNDLAKLELVEDGGLTGGIETNLLIKHRRATTRRNPVSGCATTRSAKTWHD
eukprot:1670970-Pyramimonas_sp.AAC.1